MKCKHVFFFPLTLWLGVHCQGQCKVLKMSGDADKNENMMCREKGGGGRGGGREIDGLYPALGDVVNKA